jgi:hypothetical protein
MMAQCSTRLSSSRTTQCDVLPHSSPLWSPPESESEPDAEPNPEPDREPNAESDPMEWSMELLIAELSEA